MMKNEKSLAEKAIDQGIHLNSYGVGDYRTRCPECSPTRRKKHDPCLSVTVTYESILWMCHHCDWTGGVKENSNLPYREPRVVREEPKEVAPPIPIISNTNHDLSEGSLIWLENRKISRKTAEDFKLFTKDHKLCFPYYLEGDIVLSLIHI